MGEQFLDTTKQKVSYIEKHHTVGDAKSVVEFQETIFYNLQIWPSLADNFLALRVWSKWCKWELFRMTKME